MLLNHSSGLMGGTFKNAWLMGEFDKEYLDNFLANLKPQRLKHDPGYRSIYCNDGFTLAEILIGRVSGMSFTEFLDHEFLQTLEIQNIKSPESVFDRDLLAAIYLGNNELAPQYLHAIGSGGLYAAMEDLVRFAAIFLESADGSVLSRQSADEMAKNQHQMSLVAQDADTVFSYGLGWDAVDSYPFNRYGITALSKGGSTISYHTNLTVLPEYDLAVAVSSSGKDSYEHIIAQEIILAVLMEEGLIPADAEPVMPAVNLNRALIPESVKVNAGIYSAGAYGGMMNVEFTGDSMIITPLAARNERPREYIYNTDGMFVSMDGGFMGLGFLMDSNSYGISLITFEDGYLLVQSYKDELGLGKTASAMAAAEKAAENPVPETFWQAWRERNAKEYLLVSDKHTSSGYLTPLAGILSDERIPGYVNPGIYRASGLIFPSMIIVDAYTAKSFISVPTMAGRDGKDLAVVFKNGVEYLDFNYADAVYIDAAAAISCSVLGDMVVIRDEPVWVDIDAEYTGRILGIRTSASGSWFVYDEKMNCVATSLEKNPRENVILPINGRIAFVGEAGAEFMLNFADIQR
jgi:hypothetical protein